MAKKVKREVQEKVGSIEPWELYPATGSQCHAAANHFSASSKSSEPFVASNEVGCADEDVQDALKRVFNTLAANKPNSAFTQRQVDALISTQAGIKLDSRFVEAAKVCLKNPDIGYVEYWVHEPSNRKCGYPNRSGSSNSFEIDEANVDAALASLFKADPSPAVDDDIPF